VINVRKHINKVQKLQFELMKLSSFNEFDGNKVADYLLKHRELWITCMWGRFKGGVLIPLRDISKGIWRGDTLYIYTMKDKVNKLKELAKKWNADEFGVVYRDKEEGIVTFDHTEVTYVFGSPLKKDECIVRIWWD